MVCGCCRQTGHNRRTCPFFRALSDKGKVKLIINKVLEGAEGEEIWETCGVLGAMARVGECPPSAIEGLRELIDGAVDLNRKGLAGEPPLGVEERKVWVTSYFTGLQG